MKMNRVWLCCFLSALALASCVPRAEFVGGDGEIAPVRPGVTEVSVASVRSLYRGYPATVADDWQLDVVVTANDRYGTFPNALRVQDSTGGIEIKASGRDLFTRYAVGQRLRVRCRGLVVGGYGGELSLGAVSDDPAYQNGFIGENDCPYYLKPYGEPVAVAPDTVGIAGLSDALLGRFIALDGVQFADGELSLAWCDGDADTDRHLVDRRGDTLPVRTSRRAVFAARMLPRGSGYAEGILSRFNRSYQLRVYSVRGVVMESPRFAPAQAFSF